jgi:diguanylate cyclase (GGDEF)-like protein
MAQGRAWGALDLYRRRAGAWTGVELSAVRFCVDIAASYLVLVSQRDSWQAACREIEHRSHHDQLTGLPTRALLFDRLEHAVAAATRHATAVAVLFIDVDGFKRVNDEQGHAAGDLVLAEVARRLTGTLRANDTLARLSGDEFVIVCEDLTGTPAHVDEWLNALGRRIHAELRRPPGPGQVAVTVSVSIGAATTTTRHRTTQTLLTDADRAMYHAKRLGGGRLVIADTTSP